MLLSEELDWELGRGRTSPTLVESVPLSVIWKTHMINTHFSFIRGRRACSAFTPVRILVWDFLQVSPPPPHPTPANSGDANSVHKVLPSHHPAGNVLVSSSEEPEAGQLHRNLEFLDSLAFCPGTWRLLESRLLAPNSQPTPPWDLLCTLLACPSSVHSPRESSLPPV